MTNAKGGGRCDPLLTSRIRLRASLLSWLVSTVLPLSSDRASFRFSRSPDPQECERSLEREEVREVTSDS